MLSIIIPVFNEEGNVHKLYERLSDVCGQLDQDYEMVFVNDGSRDQTLDLVKDLAMRDQGIKYLDFSRNFGHQIAVMAGLDHCTGDAAVIIDADLQDPPELILDMVKKWRSGYEVVYAQRETRKGESFIKLMTASLFYRMLKRLTSVDIPLDTGDFRLIDRKVIDLLKEMPEKHKFLRGQIAWMGFNQTKVTFQRDAREWGETGYSFGKSMKLAIDGITSFSALPLKMVTFFGFVCAFLAFIVILYTLYSKYFWDDTVPGWASLMTSVLFIGGVQMIGLGIVGEYLSRIHDNVRHRPDYIIREKKL